MIDRYAPRTGGGHERRYALHLAVVTLAVLTLVSTGCRRRAATVTLPAHLRPYVAGGGGVVHDPLSVVLAATRDAPFKPIRDPQVRHTLARYLATLAVAGPRTTPELFESPQDVIAYLINAHAAWVVALHDTNGLAPERIADVREVAFPLDGRTTTLAALESEVVEMTPKEPRAGLCLNPGLRDGPPLPAAALEGASLEWQIRDQAVRCGRTPGFWRLDEARRTLRVSAFTEYLPTLPGERRERMQRLLELIPPPAPLAGRIAAVCGATLTACTLESSSTTPR